VGQDAKAVVLYLVNPAIARRRPSRYGLICEIRARPDGQLSGQHGCKVMVERVVNTAIVIGTLGVTVCILGWALWLW
jgi:hypothetical protein